MEISIEVGRTEVGGPLSKSCGSCWKFAMLVEVGESMWGYMEAHESFHGIFVEPAIDRSNGSFHFHRQWSLPCIFMEASTNAHGSKSTSTNFHGNFHESESTSTDLHVLFHGS